jgi:DNA mismatch endonuclease (patch repair protein)
MRSSRGARIPKRNRGYWSKKITGNWERDQKNADKLEASGWQSLVVWECATRDERQLSQLLKRFLGE